MANGGPKERRDQRVGNAEELFDGHVPDEYFGTRKEEQWQFCNHSEMEKKVS